jgi:Ni2+-binding GTPase involved in maturation of urease and hydrogenase
MITKPNFLIVAGNGRNSGKTTFICRLIAHLGADREITAIKISPHFHPEDHGRDVLVKNDHFRIMRENGTDGTKDSARMLHAGAKAVFYLEVEDNHLQHAFETLLQHAKLRGPVICESGGLRHFIKPSLFILLNKKGRCGQSPGFRKLSPLADCIVIFDGKTFSALPESIGFTESRWTLE